MDSLDSLQHPQAYAAALAIVLLALALALEVVAMSTIFRGRKRAA